MIVNIFVAALISFCSATFLLFLFLKPNFAIGIPKIVYNQKIVIMKIKYLIMTLCIVGQMMNTSAANYSNDDGNTEKKTDKKDHGDDMPTDLVDASFINGILTFTYLQSICDVKILIYFDNELVDEDEVGNVSVGDTDVYNMNIYGTGSYTIYLCEGNNVYYFFNCNVN